jgi:hypothetical protein
MENLMPKTLVVVYSYTGTAARLAQTLCAEMGWPLATISDASPRAGRAPGSLRCLLDSLLRRRPAIRYDGPDPADFDNVVLIAPIWFLRLAGPMRTFVAEHRHALKQVAVVSVMGAEGAPESVAEIGRLLRWAPMLATSFTTREVEEGSALRRLNGFARAVQASGRSETAMRPALWSPSSA